MKVKQEFVDRDTGAAYAVGDIYEGSPERIAELRERGYLTKTDVTPAVEGVATEIEPVPVPEPAPTTRKTRAAQTDE